MPAQQTKKGEIPLSNRKKKFLFRLGALKLMVNSNERMIHSSKIETEVRSRRSLQDSLRDPSLFEKKNNEVEIC